MSDILCMMCHKEINKENMNLHNEKCEFLITDSFFDHEDQIITKTSFIPTYINVKSNIIAIGTIVEIDGKFYIKDK